jgi:hypothetical protein
MKTLSLLLLSLPVFGATRLSGPIEVTPQQAIIRFTTGAEPTDCTIDIQELGSGTDIPYTNISLFAGANMVSASNSIITGGGVQYVAGARQVWHSTNGNRYSASLTEATNYQGQLSCPGSTPINLTFTTTPIPQGMTHQDAPVQDTTNTITPAFPITPTLLADINGNTPEQGRQFAWNDYQTGARLHMMTMPSDLGGTFDDTSAFLTLAYDTIGTNWTFPTAWPNASGNATVANSTDPIFIGALFDPAACGNVTGGCSGISVQCSDGMCQPGYYVPVQMRFHFTASINNAACTGTNAIPECEITVSIATNGVTTDPRSQVQTYVLSNSPTQHDFGGTAVYDVGQKTGLPIWSQTEMALNSGQVICSGTTFINKNWEVGAATFSEVRNNTGSFYCIGDGTGPLGNGCHKVGTYFNAFGIELAAGDTCINGTYNSGGSSFGWLVQRVGSDTNTLTLTGAPIVFATGTEGYDPWDQAQTRGSAFDGADISGNPLQLIMGNESFYAVDRQTGFVTPYGPQAGGYSSRFCFSGACGAGFPADHNGNYFYYQANVLYQQNYFGTYQFPGNKVGSQTNLPLWQFFGNNLLQDCTGTPPNYTNKPCLTHGPIVSNVLGALGAFDTRFDPSVFGCGGGCVFLVEMQGQYAIFNVQSQNHSLSAQPWDYQAVLDTTTGNFVASRQVWGPGSRWSTDKGPFFNGRVGWTTNQSPFGPVPAQATITTTINTVSCPSGSWLSCREFIVDGDAYDPAVGIGHRTAFGPYMVGDKMWLGGTYVNTPFTNGFPNPFPQCTIITIVGATDITCGIDHDPPASAVAGQTVYMIPDFPGNFPPWANNGFGIGDEFYWNWQADPFGSNSTGQTIITNFSFTAAHASLYLGVFGTGQTYPVADPRCTIFAGNCYGMQDYRTFTDSAITTAFLNTAANEHTGISPLFSQFANTPPFVGSIGDNSIQTHPNGSCYNLQNPACRSMGDGRSYMGVTQTGKINGSFTGSTPVAGFTQVYKVVPNGTIHVKQYDTLFTSAARVYRSISGPGSTILDGSSGAYTFCWVLIANQCISGSSPGDFYVNWPFPVFNMVSFGDNCYSAGGEANGTNNNWFANDLCGPMDRIAELGELTMTSMNGYDNIGDRMLTYLGMGGNPMRVDVFGGLYPGSTSTNLPFTAEWSYYNSQCTDQNCRFYNMLVRLPKWTKDQINRSDFIGMNTHFNSLPAGASTVAVRFGYQEYNGGKCSPNYNDSCYAVTSAVNDSTPFYWKGETFTGKSCSSGCDVIVPALSGHVLYATPVGLDGSNNEVWVGPTTVSRVP